MLTPDEGIVPFDPDAFKAGELTPVTNIRDLPQHCGGKMTVWTTTVRLGQRQIVCIRDPTAGLFHTVMRNVVYTQLQSGPKVLTNV